MKPIQTLRDAAILVALILLATSVRVTALPEAPGSPATGPTAHAAEPTVAAPQPLPAPGLPSHVNPHDVATDCERHQRLTLQGDDPDDRVVIEIDIDPRLGAALGLCPTTNGDPRAVPADKA